VEFLENPSKEHYLPSSRRAKKRNHWIFTPRRYAG